MKEFEPRILAFLCNWAGYAAYDLAGVKFVELPRIDCEIRVMCTGRVDPAAVIEGLVSGYDGVMLVGCRKGECRYENGNFYAEKRVYWIRKTLSFIGLDPRRVYCNWVGADDDVAFKKYVEEFREEICSLGPIGKTEKLEVSEAHKRLLALKNVFNGEKMRWLVGKDMELAGGVDVFGEPLSRSDFEKVAKEVFKTDYERNLILNVTSDTAKSVLEISDITDIDSVKVVKEIIVLKRLGRIVMEGVREGVPLYKSIHG